MKKIVFIIIIFLLLAGCSKLLLDFEKHPRGDNPNDPMGPTPPTVENDGSWLFMVYLDAANNLEEAGVADLDEMTKVDFTGYSGKNITKIVLMDRINGYSTADGDWKGAKLIKIEPNGGKTYLSNVINGTAVSRAGNAEINMGDPNTLKDFIQYCINNYGTGMNYFLLDIWNHGGGWRNDGDPQNDIRKAICWDDDNGSDTLYMDEVQQALSAAGKKMDIIYMDACLMQMMEVNYELRNLTSYLVASEETVPGNGGDYTDIFTRYKNLTDKHTPYNFSYEIVGSYRNQYYTTSDTTLSAIDETKISAFMTALNTFADNLQKVDGAKIKDVRSKTKSFAYTDQADLYHFAQLCNEKISGGVAGASEVMSAVNALMIKEYHHGSSMSDCHGIAIYFPPNPSQVDATYWTSSGLDIVSAGSKWVNFLQWWKQQ
ncbi:MAG: clostripain-related cysteine peptidase [bacterium]|nr:clostripain-related cysteine peptidase [bacterium]